MKIIYSLITLIAAMAATDISGAVKTPKPWDNGPLRVSPEGRYLCNGDSTPFFWLGDTGWLLPERLNRDEAAHYLSTCSRAGYNVVQVQTVNGVPAVNVYGKLSMPDGFDFSSIEGAPEGEYGYWDHMDYIVDTARDNGIYIGMVCIWGGLVKGGKMDEAQAEAYGTFLGRRYKDRPNIVWIIGGDIRGDVKPEVWRALARAIKRTDPDHLMTFHPFGRTASATWFNAEDWLDFNMFQSGHRRYGQRRGDGDHSSTAETEEDNWRYVDFSLAQRPLKPVIDGEPSYEGIPQGLHDPAEPRWTAADVRRYAYWSVFAGSAGHTYGNNSIMQFYRPGLPPAYGAETPWWEALNDDGFNQMQYLKRLMTAFPYFTRVGDQSVITSPEGYRYDRVAATRGDDYLLAYTYTGKPFEVDLSKIDGKKKSLWWYNPADGSKSFIAETADKIVSVTPPSPTDGGNTDRVLVAFDSSKNYNELF